MGRTRHEFTLVELLVIVAIVTVLSAMLVPALTRDRGQAGGQDDYPSLERTVLALGLYRSGGYTYTPSYVGGEAARITTGGMSDRRAAREVALARLRREIAEETR